MTGVRAALGRSWLPAALLFGVALLGFAIRSLHGIHFMTFGDESGHLLGARAIAAGDRLYRDFIDAHGPLCFMVAHAFGVLFGWTEPLDARWAVVVFALTGAGSVATSPILRGAAARLWGGALFIGLITAPWLVQGLSMVDYHVLGGMLATVALAWMVVPLWAGLPVARWQAGVAGVSLAGLCAAAYALVPSALLLGTSALLALRSLPRQRALPIGTALVTGFAVGCTLIVVWLLVFGDVIGMVVFHVIDNQVNYSRYALLGSYQVFRSLMPDLSPGALVQSGASIACLIGLAAVAPRRGPGATFRWGAWAFGVAAVLMLNFRGMRLFQDGSFLIVGMAQLAPGLPRLVGGKPSLRAAWAMTGAFGLLMAGYEAVDRAALASPSPLGATREIYIAWPPLSLRVQPDNPITRRIRQVLRPGERLLVLVYNPDLYLGTGTLPVRKYKDYLPWEADYARAPWFGRDRDLCKDIQAQPPPVISYDGWIVWGRYDPAKFMACVPALLSREYIADAVPNLFIRKDRY